MVLVVGGHLWAFRILPALAAGGYALLGGLTAREYGYPRRHQIAATAAVAMTAVVLALGHLFETTTFDMAVSAAALWLLVRALRSEPQRWPPWIWVGVLTGIAMEIKVLVAPVLLCCLLGVLIAGPRRRLLGPRPWVAAGIAFVLAAPNLIWQASHGLPMRAIAADIAAGGSTSSTSRATLLPIILLEIGPVVSVVLVVGLVTLLRRPLRRTGGWLAVALLIFIAFTLISGGKAYYPAAFYPAVLAVGAGPVLDWVRRRRWHRVLGVALVAVSLLVTPALTLPLGPPGSALYDIASGPNPDLASEVGWPGYVDQVARVVASVPAGERRQAILLTSNYQEAGALSLLQPTDGTALPRVYSGHNGFWYWGPPPDTTTAAVVVGDVSTDLLTADFARCEQLGRLVSPAGVDNDESDAPIRLCTGRTQPWSVIWPTLKRLG